VCTRQETRWAAVQTIVLLFRFFLHFWIPFLSLILLFLFFLLHLHHHLLYIL
jgi:hypothetical protein